MAASYRKITHAVKIDKNRSTGSVEFIIIDEDNKFYLCWENGEKQWGMKELKDLTELAKTFLKKIVFHRLDLPNVLDNKICGIIKPIADSALRS